MCLATFAYPKALPREQANAVENDEWQNDWEGELFVECGPKDAVIWIHSEYSNNYGDRRWRFDCDEVSPTGT